MFIKQPFGRLIGYHRPAAVVQNQQRLGNGLGGRLHRSPPLLGLGKQARIFNSGSHRIGKGLQPLHILLRKITIQLIKKSQHAHRLILHQQRHANDRVVVLAYQPVG